MPKKKCEIITIHKDLFEALVYVKFCSHIIVKPKQEGWRTPDADTQSKYALIENDKLDILKKSIEDFEDVLKFCDFSFK